MLDQSLHRVAADGVAQHLADQPLASQIAQARTSACFAPARDPSQAEFWFDDAS